MRIRSALLLAAAVAGLSACGPAAAPEAASEARTGEATPAAETSAAGTRAAGLKLGGDGVPRFRNGWWEIVSTEEGQTETSHRCIGDEIDAEVREMLTRETPTCQTRRSATQGGLEISAVCAQTGGLKTETELVMTGSDVAYDVKFGLYVVMPDGARDGGVTTMKARWTGACPPGVKPGEEIEG